MARGQKNTKTWVVKTNKRNPEEICEILNKFLRTKHIKGKKLSVAKCEPLPFVGNGCKYIVPRPELPDLDNIRQQTNESMSLSYYYIALSNRNEISENSGRKFWSGLDASLGIYKRKLHSSQKYP